MLWNSIQQDGGIGAYQKMKKKRKKEIEPFLIDENSMRWQYRDIFSSFQ